VEIEIYSDVVCPWCYLGKRRLDAALASFDDDPYAGEVTLRWRPFQLDPDAPRDGRPLLGWLGTRFGGEARARAAGKTFMTLNTTQRMRAAQAMYERLGYERAEDILFPDGFVLLGYSKQL